MEILTITVIGIGIAFIEGQPVYGTEFFAGKPTQTAVRTLGGTLKTYDYSTKKKLEGSINLTSVSRQHGEYTKYVIEDLCNFREKPFTIKLTNVDLGAGIGNEVTANWQHETTEGVVELRPPNTCDLMLKYEAYI